MFLNGLVIVEELPKEENRFRRLPKRTESRKKIGTNKVKKPKPKSPDIIAPIIKLTMKPPKSVLKKV